jgi:predicted O-methyltransferase YrrM
VASADRASRSATPIQVRAFPPKDTADLHGWQVLRPLLHGRPFLPWTRNSIGPAALASVCNEIALSGRREIVELGSGVSTVVIARLLQERGGRLHSVEHDDAWLAWVASQLEREGLTDVARLVHAPLAADPLAHEGLGWYDREALDALPATGIDLLLVDGPPADQPGTEQARYPALPALADRLGPDATVVLDDASRPGEQSILEAWTNETAIRFERSELARVAIGRRAG